MRKYKVLTPIKAGKDRIEPGETLEMEEKEAAPLISASVLADPATASDPDSNHAIDDGGKKEPRPKNKADRIAAISDEISTLDDKDEAHFTEGGLPDANVLSDRLGWEVSAKERDTAWENMKMGSVVA